MPKIRSIVVSELTHSSLFLLQAKLMVSDKKKYSMNEILNKLLTVYDKVIIPRSSLEAPFDVNFKLENIET